jgi:hypothetical protein
MEQQYHMLYKTTCTVTGNFYIGVHSTKNLEDGYLGSGLRLLKSISKHGKENHRREILELFETRQAMYKREREIVNEEMLSNTRCMNLNRGGEGGWSTESQLKNNRASLLRQKWLAKNNPGWKKQRSEKISISNSEQFKNGERSFIPNWSGKTLDQNHRSSIGKANSVSQKGEKNSQYGKIWVTNEKESKLVDKAELDSLIQQGWRKGRRNNEIMALGPKGPRGFESLSVPQGVGGGVVERGALISPRVLELVPPSSRHE